MTDDYDAQIEIENEISDKVSKYLELEPLRWVYKNEVSEIPMQICVKEFFERLTPNAPVEKQLDYIAVDGECIFKWDVGYWNRKEEKTVTINNPTWADLFKTANQAYIDGGCPDHHFLECFFREKSGDYKFFFGS